MKILQVGGIIVATAITAACLTAMGKKLIAAPPSAVAESEVSEKSSSYIVPFAMPDEPPKGEQLIFSEEQSVPKGLETQPAKSEELFSAQTKDKQDYRMISHCISSKQGWKRTTIFSVRDYSRDATPPNSDTLYLSFYPYAELPPERKPADIRFNSLRNVQIGTPLEEIKRASDAFGLDFSFMRTVAKIKSDFDPKQRTGSYIGLFSVSKYEFAKYGSGEITSPRDNAIAAAYKFVTEARLFKWDTQRTDVQLSVSDSPARMAGRRRTR